MPAHVDERAEPLLAADDHDRHDARVPGNIVAELAQLGERADVAPALAKDLRVLARGDRRVRVPGRGRDSPRSSAASRAAGSSGSGRHARASSLLARLWQEIVASGTGVGAAAHRACVRPQGLRAGQVPLVVEGVAHRGSPMAVGWSAGASSDTAPAWSARGSRRRRRPRTRRTSWASVPTRHAPRPSR